jgi:uncharacterized protein
LKVGFLVRILPDEVLKVAGLSGRSALITGASSGLGAEFADQLARKGYNLILVARRKEQLQQIAETIQSHYPVQITVLPADLSKMTDIERVVSTIDTLSDLDFLINNAGFGAVGRFIHIDPNVELAMLSVHIIAPAMLCRAAVPGMLSRNHGAIINVSSLAGLVPIRNVVYYSTKAFLISFSQALRNELLSSQVRVQALCPGFVYTDFHDTLTHFSRSSIPGFLWMTPDQVVSESLKSIQSRRWICVPGRLNSIVGALARNSLSAGLIRLSVQIVLRKRRTFITAQE